MQNLKGLVLDDNKNLSDLTPIENLTNLTLLAAPRCNVSNIDSLKNLTNLTTLWLNNNHISDMSPLKGLTNLTELHLDGQTITGPEVTSVGSKAIVSNMIKGIDGNPIAIANGDG